MPELYPIGKYLRVNHSGYHPVIFKIIGYGENELGETIYISDVNFGPLNEDNKVHPKYTIDDYECKKLDRKLKLQCLNSIQ